MPQLCLHHSGFTNTTSINIKSASTNVASSNMPQLCLNQRNKYHTLKSMHMPPPTSKHLITKKSMLMPQPT
eukprot:1152525-Pelagomonas_calceolata.AAC.2